jgi:clan AA aspartic protease
MAESNLLEIIEDESMGRVTTSARVENLKDLYDADRGLVPLHEVRRLDIADALVDTGATTLALPLRMIHELGLKKVRERSAITSQGTVKVGMYEAVRLTIIGRECVVEVMEVSDATPPLIGQIPLEMLDLVVNPLARKLTTNPEHGGEHILELL